MLNDQATIDELDDIIEHGSIECIVVSPGPGTPTSCRDAGVNLEVFSRYTNVPVLGVCFGFQCLCQVHGGASIVRAPLPVHGRTSAVHHDGDPLFRNIPSGPSYEVVRYHSLCVDPDTLDAEVVVPLAWSWANPSRPGRGAPLGDVGVKHDSPRVARRVMMAAKHVAYPHYGVQFHPESICTTHGRVLLENFRDLAAAWNASRKGRQGGERVILGIKDLPSPQDIAVAPGRAGSNPPPFRDAPSARLGVKVEVINGCLNDILGGTARVVEEIFARDGTRDVFFLDSATPERTRFSYMGGVGGPLWRRVSYTLNDDGGDDDGDNDDTGGTLTVEDRRGSTRVADCSSVFDWVTGQTRFFSEFDDRLASLPFEFWGGPVGYLGYELKCQTGGRRVHRSDNCDACFFVVDRFICADHHTGDLYVVAVYNSDVGDHGAEAASWVAEVAAACRRLRHTPEAAEVDPEVGIAARPEQGTQADRKIRSSSAQYRLPPLSSFTERHPQAAYIEKVARCQASLYSGDSYELCLTNMLRSPRTPGDADPWSVYKQLRRRNPAPYAAFLDFSAGTPQGRRTSRVGPVLCCSSPERFLRGTRDGALEAKPIKGTARRHPNDPQRDEEAARELLESEKDRAENLMIVDLLRNDLGRVAETGSVRVPGLMRLESFATVHQMVRTIVAQKQCSVGTGEVIRAAFPGGSMTGAPKIRSMAILDALEEGPRGVYSGSLGYISWNGAFDLNIVIRTAIFNDGEILVGAGGAIVVQSDPRGEYDEMRLKFETLRVA